MELFVAVRLTLLSQVFAFLVFAIGAPASAGVIYSACKVQPTDGSRPNYEPKSEEWLAETRSGLRSYSDDMQYALYLLTYLTSGKEELSMDPRKYEEDARAVGHWIEDLQLASELAAEEENCLSEKAPITQALAIVPYAIKPASGVVNGQTIRIRYKVCEFYNEEILVDNQLKQRQILFEEGCRVIGSETGYSIAQLEKRLAGLRAGLRKTRDNLDVGLYLGTALASLTTLKGMRAFKMGRITSLTAALVPPAIVAGGIKLGLRDEFLRELTDLEGAAELPLLGDLSTDVKVSSSIQTFVPYFERYLNSIEERSKNQLKNY